jgi:outer membrane protein
LIFIVIFLFPAVALGEEARGLTASEAAALAWERHPRLRQVVVEVRAARARARGEEALLSTALDAQVSVGRDEEPTRGLIEDGVRQSDLAQANVGLSRRLRWGTDLNLQLNQSWFRAEQPFVLPGAGRQTQVIGPLWQQELVLTLRQPLLRGFGEGVTLLPERSARAQVGAAEAQRRQAASEVLLEVLGAFLELAWARRDLEIRERQVVFAQEQREATVAQIEAGRLAPSELDVIEQRGLTLEEARLVGEHELRTRAAALARLLGLGGARLEAEEALEVEGAAAPLEELQGQARARNPALLALREQREALRLRLEGSQDAALPQLDLTAAAGQRSLSEEGLWEASGQLVGLEATRLFAGLVLTVPLDNGRAEAQVEAARLDLERLELQIEEAEGLLDQQVEEARGLVTLGEARLALAERGAALARRGLEAERARFAAGRSTNQQVLQFQEEVERAEVRALRTRVDLAQGRLRLEHLSGALLERWAPRAEAP